MTRLARKTAIISGGVTGIGQPEDKARAVLCRRALGAE